MENEMVDRLNPYRRLDVAGRCHEAAPDIGMDRGVRGLAAAPLRWWGLANAVSKTRPRRSQDLHIVRCGPCYSGLQVPRLQAHSEAGNACHMKASAYSLLALHPDPRTLK